MKKYFITGLIILLPLTLTFAIIAFIFNLLTDPFVDIVTAIMSYYGIADKGFLIFSPSQVQELIAKILIIIFLFGFTVLLGMFARWVFFHYFLQLWDYLIHRIPFVSSLYRTFQDIINTFFTQKNQAFKQVVLVPFPSRDTYGIGLVTKKGLPDLNNEGKPDLVAVFVPATPNPTSGFMTLYKESDIVYLDMKTDDAFKYIISCGVIAAPLRTANKDPLDP